MVCPTSWFSARNVEISVGRDCGEPVLTNIQHLVLGPIPLVSSDDAVPQRDLRRPAERFRPTAVQQLARRSIRPGGVEGKRAAVAHHAGDHFRQLAYRDVLPGADVYVFSVV